MLGETLSRLRELKKLTQQQVADKIHISRATYAQYEIDRRVPEYLTLEKLADFFEVTIDFLVGREDIEYGKNKTNFIVDELVKKYNIDLSIEGEKENLEKFIKLYVDFRKS